LTFNKYAGTKFEAKLATFDVLDAIKAKPGRVCPLVCEHGFKPDGEVCVKINCRTDYRVNAENECEKTDSRKPVATRDQSTTREDARQQSGKSTKPVAQRSGQMVCNGAGCRPVRPGCHLEVYQQGKHGPGSWGMNQEVCN
jgi:hypothetical protein